MALVSKTVHYPEGTFHTITGYPFMIPHPDSREHRKALLESRALGREDYIVPNIEADFSRLICWFLDGMPWEKDDTGKPTWRLTVEDTTKAALIIEALLGKQNGVIELGEIEHSWLLNKVNSPEGVLAFHNSRRLVERALMNMETTA